MGFKVHCTNGPNVTSAHSGAAILCLCCFSYSKRHCSTGSCSYCDLCCFTSCAHSNSAIAAMLHAPELLSLTVCRSTAEAVSETKHPPQPHATREGITQAFCCTPTTPFLLLVMMCSALSVNTMSVSASAMKTSSVSRQQVPPRHDSTHGD